MAGWNPKPLLITGLLLGLSVPAVATPFVEEVDPPVLRRGAVTQITLRGRDLHQAEGVWLSLPNARAIGFVAGSSPDEATLEVSVPSEAPLGMCGLRLATKSGLSNVHIVLIDELPITRAVPTTNSKPLAVSLPCCVSAPCRPAAVDRYSIKVSAGQTVSFEAVGSRFGKNHDPLVTIRDSSGRVLAQRDNDPGLFYDCRFARTFEKSGEYIVEVRDARYEGDESWNYALRIGSFPAANVVVPSAAKLGSTSEVTLPELGSTVTLTVPQRPRMSIFNQEIRRSPGEPASWVTFHASDSPPVIELEPNDDADETATLATIPATLNGILSSPEDRDCFAFPMTRGQTINITAESREIGSPADLELILIDPTDRELRRLDDASYVHKKVAVPIEARTIFAAQKDGLHFLMIRELVNGGGPSFAYRVDIHETKPSMKMAADVSRLTVPQKSWQPVPIKVTRDRLAGPIELKLVGAPPGVTLEPSTIPADQTKIVCRLAANDSTTTGIYSFEITGHWKSEDGKQEATAVVGTHPMIDRQRIDKDRRLYSLRENQLRLPPSLRSRFALMVTPPAPYSIDLPENSIILTKYQTSSFPIETTRDDGFDSPIRFHVAGDQIGVKEQERDQIYAAIPEATASRRKVDGVFFNRINTAYRKTRVDLTAIAMRDGHEVTLFRTFELDVRPAFRPAFEQGSLTALPGETLNLKLHANRSPTWDGEITLAPFQSAVNLDLPIPIVFSPSQETVDVAIPIPADRSPGRIYIRWRSAGQVGRYEENIIEPTLSITVRKPPKKK